MAYPLLALGRFDDAVESLERGMEVHRDSAELLASLGNVLKTLGRPDEAAANYRKALALEPDLPVTRNNLIFTLRYMAETSSAEIRAEAEKFGDVVRSKAEPFADWNVPRDPAKRLRVGMVSGDLRTHVVGRYLESFLGHIDRSRVELVAYSTTATEDDATARLRPHFALWHNVVGLDDGTLAGLIHDDAVDILIDLSGHSAGNRLPMFAYKPAPVQATWLGLFATSGVPGMDYIIADPYLVPDDRGAILHRRGLAPGRELVLPEPPKFQHRTRPPAGPCQRHRHLRLLQQPGKDDRWGGSRCGPKCWTRSPAQGCS